MFINCEVIELDKTVAKMATPKAPAIFLASAKTDEAVAHYSLENLPNKVMATEYRMVLPNEKVLTAELKRPNERWNRVKSPTRPCGKQQPVEERRRPINGLIERSPPMAIAGCLVSCVPEIRKH